MNTSIIFGFTKFLRDVIQREKPDMLGVAFDPPGGCFRRELYPEYKANRGATPEDIIESVPYIKDVVEAMGIPILQVAGYEADDVIGTLSKMGEDAGCEVFMVTPDKDYGQLVTPHCKIYKQKDNQVEIVDVESINAKYGIDNPQLVSDILAIWGDASDNIPGVMGIGEKGACKLVQQWGDVESIIANVDKIKGKQGERIASSVEQLRLSKQLTLISLDVPVEFSPDKLMISSPDAERLHSIFTQLDIRAFEGNLYSTSAVKAQPIQEELGLFSTQSAPASPALSGQLDLFSAPQVADAVVNNSTELESSEIEEEVVELSTIDSTPHDYQIVKGAEDVKELCAKLMQYGEVCFDCETTGLDPFKDKIVGMSFAVKEFEAYYVPFDSEDYDKIVDALRPLFESEAIVKIGQNIKFDISMLRTSGVEVQGRLIDTMILHYLLDSESRHNMNYLSQRYLNYNPISIETLIGKGVRQLTMDRVAVELVAPYAAEDADVTLRLKNVLWKLIEDEGFVELYNNIEEPMIRLLLDMEMEGVKLDSQALGIYAKELNLKLEALSESIRQQCDSPELNVNSSVQLGEVLFGKLKIADKPKMTKTKRYATDEEYLQGFAKKHKVVSDILEYRGVKKLLSTYVEALPELVNPVTGRVHTSYNQAVTATGRLSSTNPNLQNIPIRDSLSQPIRRAFIPSSNEHLILSADYSQVELRIMAHLSGDEAMLEAFAKGEDIHSATAALLYHTTIDGVTSEQRRRAKTANFGIIYGISPFGLSQRLDIPRSEAKEIIDGYFASYPQVKEYMDSSIEKARERGYVETLYGRRRQLVDISSRSAVTRGIAERNAINAPIQGSAADIMKLAMIGIYRKFRQEKLRSKMIMQVHDEIVIDMLISERERVESIVVEQMERAAKLSVTLLAECGVGDNWLQAH